MSAMATRLGQVLRIAVRLVALVLGAFMFALSFYDPANGNLWRAWGVALTTGAWLIGEAIHYVLVGPRRNP